MNKFKYYKKVFSYFKSYKKSIIIYLIISLILIGMGTIVPFLSAKTIQAITSSDITKMLMFGLFLFFTNTIYRVFMTISRRLSYKIEEFISLDIKADASKKLFELETKNFDKNGTGFFSSRINGEPSGIARIISMIRYNFLGTTSSFGVLIYLFVINYKISIMLLLFSLALFYIQYKRTKERTKIKEKLKDLEEDYSSNFNEIVRGIRDIKVLNVKNTMINKTLNKQREIFQIDYKDTKKQDYYDMLYDVISGLGEFLIIVMGIFFIKNNQISAANLLVIYMYKREIFSIFNQISRGYSSYKEFNLSIERLYSVIDGENYQKEKYGNYIIDKLNGEIEFRNVNFGYNDKQVLKNMNFKINPNETVGIVGKSGQGKTTIFNLISKLYSVDNGSIFLDGIDINELTEDSIKNNISVITQDPYIFNTTIRENLKIVKEDMTEEEMIESAKLCALHDFVETLENKYDSKVGEDGIMLSGGQKQRLAIARALIKKSEIILLDEATSSLDNQTQDYIKESIKMISKNYTMLIIAHRLSTIKDCDKIIVIDDGMVVGIGTHRELIKNNKIYKELYKKELFD